MGSRRPKLYMRFGILGFKFHCTLYCTYMVINNLGIPLTLVINWYTLVTQNGQPLNKGLLPPFIEQGGEGVTM